MLICGLLLSIVMVLLAVQVTFTRKTVYLDTQLGVLESGFESLKRRLFVRSPYFFLAVLFVLFDLELVLLLPGIFFSVTLVYSVIT